MAEPVIDSPPVRIGRDGTTAHASSLREIRDNMDKINPELVVLLRKRFTLTQDAVHFKNDLDEVRAPLRQAENLNNLVAIAEELWPEDLLFHQHIRAVGGTMIARAVEAQEIVFETTIPLC